MENEFRIKKINTKETADLRNWRNFANCFDESGRFYANELQPKTKIVGKVSKTLKNDTTFRFQLNLRGTQGFL